MAEMPLTCVVCQLTRFKGEGMLGCWMAHITTQWKKEGCSQKYSCVIFTRYHTTVDAVVKSMVRGFEGSVLFNAVFKKFSVKCYNTVPIYICLVVL